MLVIEVTVTSGLDQMPCKCPGAKNNTGWNFWHWTLKSLCHLIRRNSFCFLSLGLVSGVHPRVAGSQGGRLGEGDRKGGRGRREEEANREVKGVYQTATGTSPSIDKYSFSLLS